MELFRCRERYRVYLDAVDALRIAKVELNLKVAIVTTIPRFMFMQVIKALSQYLDLVMTGSEAGCDKSNPKMYLGALEKLKVSPEKAVVVGDDEYVDVILPKKIGMRTIQIVRRGVRKCELADAHVSNLIDAMNVVREWMKNPRG